MPKREMEGDNRFRRKKAREARRRGKKPSEEGTTLGASKQRHHLHRDPHGDRTTKHERKIQTIRKGKQRSIRENTPEQRPRSRRPDQPMTRDEHL